MPPLMPDLKADPIKEAILRMETSSWQKAGALAKTLGHSRNDFIVNAVRQFIADHEKGMTPAQLERYQKALAEIVAKDGAEESEPPKPTRGKGRRP